MSDIVKELLSRASDQDGIGWTPTTIIPVPARLLHHAADRIEQLEEALRGVIGWLEDPEGGSHEEDMREASRIARAALEERT